jgi:hypothetical protein
MTSRADRGYGIGGGAPLSARPAAATIAASESVGRTMTDLSPDRRFESWRSAFDVGAGALMLVLAFVGIAASDVAGGGSQVYWSGLAIAFGLICVALDWIHEPRGTAWLQPALRTALHWLGVLLAIELVYVLIDAGRLTNASTGLLNGTILALGTFTSGVHTNWRLLVIGVALGLGTATAAYVERYLWILFALALLALALIIFIGRLRARRDG